MTTSDKIRLQHQTFMVMRDRLRAEIKQMEDWFEVGDFDPSDYEVVSAAIIAHRVAVRKVTAAINSVKETYSATVKREMEAMA